MSKLDGKVVVVTGASRGIGKAIAKGMALEGASLAILGRTSSLSDPSELSIERTVQEIKDFGGIAQGYFCDVTDESSVNSAFLNLREELGSVDVLVNNAGVLARVGFLETSISLWDSIMRTNLDGVYFCTMAVLSEMCRRNSGVIINISSSRGYSDDAQSTAYAVSKAGLDRLTIKLATELLGFGISVNSLQPGLTMTELMAKKNPDLLEMSPKWTEEKNIIPACVWLAAQQGTDVTGQVLDERDFGSTWPIKGISNPTIS